MTAQTQPRDNMREIVFVVDDDSSVREAVKDLLASVGLEVQAFASAREFLSGPRPDAPGCLVLDIRMPGTSGLDLQRKMADLDIKTPIIFITAHGDVHQSVRAMKAGAIELLTKPFRDEDLLEAIQSAIGRDRERREKDGLLAELRNRFADLNSGERDVLVLVAQGLLNKQIAAALGVSEITVKVRRGQMMRKMQADSLADLIRMADKLGFTGKPA